MNWPGGTTAMALGQFVLLKRKEERKMNNSFTTYTLFCCISQLFLKCLFNEPCLWESGTPVRWDGTKLNWEEMSASLQEYWLCWKVPETRSPTQRSSCQGRGQHSVSGSLSEIVPLKLFTLDFHFGSVFWRHLLRCKCSWGRVINFHQLPGYWWRI